MNLGDLRLSDAPPALLRADAAGRQAFGSDWAPGNVVLAPGRLELLGNHIDYNGGPVLAGAIDRFVAVLVDDRPGDGDDIAVVMVDTDDRQPVQHQVRTLAGWRNPQESPRPHDYVRGVIATSLDRDRTRLRRGAKVVVAGDVPIGFGLSSSAALCVGLTLGLNRGEFEDRDLVLRAQEAEHRAGTPCGTMDQSASVGGGIIRYDGATTTFERLDPDLGDLVFAVADSGVHRSLGESSYPQRVAESHEALAIANRHLDRSLPNLAAMTVDEFALVAPFLSPLHVQRVRHVITETARVRDGITAVEHGDWVRFGELMTRSGRSSATDYAISHPKVEALVEAALAVEGVLGARMMGGGEGGTALILVPDSQVGALRLHLNQAFYARDGSTTAELAVHVFAFAPGARIAT